MTLLEKLINIILSYQVSSQYIAFQKLNITIFDAKFCENVLENEQISEAERTMVSEYSIDR